MSESNSEKKLQKIFRQQFSACHGGHLKAATHTGDTQQTPCYQRYQDCCALGNKKNLMNKGIEAPLVVFVTCYPNRFIYIRAKVVTGLLLPFLPMYALLHLGNG